MINTIQARYLKHEGENLDVKVSIREVAGHAMIYIRDFEFADFNSALRCLQRIGEQERPHWPDLGAKFIGLQETEIAGLSIRVYNVVGNHPLAGSTVSARTLVEQGIPVSDLTPEELQAEVELVTAWEAGAEIVARGTMAEIADRQGGSL